MADIKFVSIHARHFWRASLYQAHLKRAFFKVSIHARHFWRASHPTRTHHCGQERFNPRPSFLAGEPTAQVCASRRCWCFNPRPSFLAGEPGADFSGRPA